MVQAALSQDYDVVTVDLSSGQVAADIDVLVLVAPQGLTDRERFAVDQYLMRGGSVVAAAGNYGISTDPYTGGLLLEPITDGIGSLLSAYGLTVEPELVLDTQNEPFPVPVTRQVGTMSVQEIQAVPYPYFVDVRSAGLASDNPIVSGLSAVTLQWASPVTVDATANISREVTSLIQSSADSWVSADAVAQPDYDTYPDLGFATGDTTQPETLAVAVLGSFTSAFKGQSAPAATTVDPTTGETVTDQSGVDAASDRVIESSPETVRLVLIGSGEFLDDTILNLSASMSGDRYLNNLQLIKNAVDWCGEDLELLGIRARGNSTHLLASLSEGQQSFWEGANYVLALLSLAARGIYWYLRRRNEKPMILPVPASAIDNPQPRQKEHH
jgi:ABC-2 type transport system permease protein